MITPRKTLGVFVYSLLPPLVFAHACIDVCEISLRFNVSECTAYTFLRCVCVCVLFFLEAKSLSADDFYSKLFPCCTPEDAQSDRFPMITTLDASLLLLSYFYFFPPLFCPSLCPFPLVFRSRPLIR